MTTGAVTYLQQSRAALQQAKLNILDELYLHLDRDEEPFSVHMEVQVDGHVDGDRLRAAIAEAASRHPIARARLRDSRATDRRYHWEVRESLEEVPLEELDGGAEAERERLQSLSPPVDEAPPFAASLVHDPDGDWVMLNLKHAAGDGMSAARLMGSILRAYGGEDDPVPAVDPLEVRDIQEIVGAESIADRIGRVRALVEHVARFVTPPTRIAPDGGSDEIPGYGFELLKFSAGEAATVMKLKRDGATANDVLLGALAAAIRRWNEDHGQGSARIALMMPVNLRPKEWQFDVVGNYASYVTVHIPEDAQEDLESAIAAAHESTTRIKEDGIAGLIVDLLEFPTVLPTAIKQRLEQLIPLTGNMVVDTAVLSNLGKLDALPRLGGEAGDVKAIWFSPPGRMPLGASFGVATMSDELFVTLRYRHALFDAAAATAFAGLYRDILLGKS
jgi:NRPS condensation-like uncharacterized protein